MPPKCARYKEWLRDASTPIPKRALARLKKKMNENFEVVVPPVDFTVEVDASDSDGDYQNDDTICRTDLEPACANDSNEYFSVTSLNEPDLIEEQNLTPTILQVVILPRILHAKFKVSLRSRKLGNRVLNPMKTRQFTLARP